MGPGRQGDAAASAHAVFFPECDVAGGCACDVRVHTFAWPCRQTGTGVRAAGQGSTTALRAIPRSNKIASPIGRCAVKRPMVFRVGRHNRKVWPSAIEKSISVPSQIAGTVAHQRRDMRLLDPKYSTRLSLREVAIFDNAIDLQREIGFNWSCSGLTKPISAKTVPLLFSKVMRFLFLIAIINCSFPC